MERKLWCALLALPWLAALALALWLSSIWDRLPARMAVHFNASGVANGWDSPEHMLSILALAVLLALAVFGGLGMVQFLRGAPPWGYVLGYDLAGLGILAITASIFNFALHPDASSIPAMPLGLSLLIGIVLMVLFLAVRSIRGSFAAPVREPHWTAPAEPVPQQPGRLVVEEIHDGRQWLLLFIPVAALFLVLGAVCQDAARWGFWLSGGALTVIVVLPAWDGFHYRFTTTGVEVKTLGWRLRWIPLPEIKEYRAEPCNPLIDFGGWGYRARRGVRAYILSGRSGVRIRTWSGDFYLGHAQPGRLVRDLDVIMKPAVGR